MSGEHVVIEAIVQTLNEIGAPTTDENGCGLSVNGRLTDWLGGRREPKHTGASEIGVVKHRPTRGSDVEEWIKHWRDEFEQGGTFENVIAHSLLHDLLEQYRLHADTGKLLDEEVEEP